MLWREEGGSSVVVAVEEAEAAVAALAIAGDAEPRIDPSNEVSVEEECGPMHGEEDEEERGNEPRLEASRRLVFIALEVNTNGFG